MLSNLEELKLRQYTAEFPDISNSSAALTFAIDAEYYKEACGAFDPQYSHFSTLQRKLEDFAYLLERKENETHIQTWPPAIPSGQRSEE